MSIMTEDRDVINDICRQMEDWYWESKTMLPSQIAWKNLFRDIDALKGNHLPVVIYQDYFMEILGDTWIEKRHPWDPWTESAPILSEKENEEYDDVMQDFFFLWEDMKFKDGEEDLEEYFFTILKDCLQMIEGTREDIFKMNDVYSDPYDEYIKMFRTNVHERLYS